MAIIQECTYHQARAKSFADCAFCGAKGGVTPGITDFDWSCWHCDATHEYSYKESLNETY
jgi:hypothetical protein